MTQVTNHLNHSTWECKYHVVFTSFGTPPSAATLQAPGGYCCCELHPYRFLCRRQYLISHVLLYKVGELLLAGRT